MEENKEPIKKEKETIDKDTIKNLVILSTGMTLIILAIVVFLATSWESIPNLLKILILSAFEFLFLGISSFTKKKFKLNNVSKTLFYIAMIYIPVCFISISFLELMGEYLSIYGEGKYIFLSAASIITMIAYYSVAKKTNDEYMFTGSSIAQLASVIFATAIFNQNILLIIIVLLLYNLMLIIFAKIDVYKMMSNALPFILSVGILSQINDNSWYLVISWFLLSINFLTLEINKSNLFTSLFYNIAIYVFAFCLIFKKGPVTNYLLCQGLMTLLILVFYGINNIICLKIKNNKNLYKTSRILSLIFILLLYVFAIPVINGMPLYIIAIATEIIIICNYLQTQNTLYKYLAYIFSNVIFINIYMNVYNNMEFIKIIPIITTSVIIIFEFFNHKEDNGKLTIFLAIIEVISFICVSMFNAMWSVFLSIVFSILILAYNKKKNINTYYNLIPFMGLIPCITNKDLDTNFCTLIMLGLTLITTGISVISEKRHTYLIISIIYLIILGLKLNNEYFIIITVILWSIIQVINEKDEIIRNILKTILVTSATVLYYLFMRDLDLLGITVIKLAGISICGMYIICEIIRKYIEEVDAFEYIFWIGIYLYGIMDYTDFQNGLLFGLSILIIIFISYYKKYGATFLVSTFAIAINLINLTKEFWELIPWWIYLSLVGGILVLFAIVNEMNKNNPNKISFKTIVKKYNERFKINDNN